MELPPVAQRVAGQIHRGLRMFADPETIAALIVCSGQVAEGLAALQTLEVLRARHVKVAIPDRWKTGVVDVHVCNHCRTAWPCDDAVTLGSKESSELG